MKPPFPYFGGKTRLAGSIVYLLPQHDHYVEPFGGSLAVLLTKPRSRMETVNDLDGDLQTFWRVLRDQPSELARVCAMTPHSRAEIVNPAWPISAPTTPSPVAKAVGVLATRLTGRIASRTPMRSPSTTPPTTRRSDH